jgi:hypothetical protein
MSLALMFGAVITYPMNWWLVAHHLKHGMMTIRPKGEASAILGIDEKMEMASSSGSAIHSPSPPVWVMAAISFVVLAAGAAIALTFGGGH